jgi:hypothetical protein
LFVVWSGLKMAAVEKTQLFRPSLDRVFCIVTFVWEHRDNKLPVIEGSPAFVTNSKFGWPSRLRRPVNPAAGLCMLWRFNLADLGRRALAAAALTLERLFMGSPVMPEESS